MPRGGTISRDMLRCNKKSMTSWLTHKNTHLVCCTNPRFRVAHLLVDKYAPMRPKCIPAVLYVPAIPAPFTCRRQHTHWLPRVDTLAEITYRTPQVSTCRGSIPQENVRVNSKPTPVAGSPSRLKKRRPSILRPSNHHSPIRISYY